MELQSYLDNTQAQLRRGTLEYCVLLAIARCEAYASDIIALLKGNNLLVVEGTLYPILSRLREAGLVSYSWAESSEGPPRKYYALTDSGRSAVRSLTEAYRALSDSINKLSQTI